MAEESTYSNEVLEETPGRVTDFLLGLGADSAIRTLLAGAGLTDEDVEEGQALLMACFGSKKPPSDSELTKEAKEQREATAALSPMDEDLFPRAKAALDRFDPDASLFLLEGLSVQESASDSLTVLAPFCANYRALETGSNEARAKRREQDKAAIAHLAKRNITPQKIAEIEALLAKALGPTPAKEPSQAREIRRQKLTKLKQWYDDWAATAHSVLKKKGQLIRVGLAKRRSPSPSPK